MKPDILFIVDDLDIIKQCMHRIKDAIETIQPKPFVICRSTNDFANDSEIRSCGKVVIIIDQITALRGTVLKACTAKLAEKKIPISKALILQQGGEEGTSECKIEKINVVETLDLMDISSWWPHLLRFLFRKSCFRFTMRSSDYMVLNISSNDRYAKKQTEMLEKTLDVAELGKGTKEEEVDCIVVVVKSMTKLSTEERSKLLDIQNRSRLGKQFFHILRTGETELDSTSSELCESVHNTEELLRLVLWVFMDLGVVHVVRKDLKTRLNQLCTRQFVLKVIGAILWICLGIPTMLAIDMLGIAIILTILGIVIVVILLSIPVVFIYEYYKRNRVIIMETQVIDPETGKVVHSNREIIPKHLEHLYEKYVSCCGSSQYEETVPYFR